MLEQNCLSWMTLNLSKYTLPNLSRENTLVHGCMNEIVLVHALALVLKFTNLFCVIKFFDKIKPQVNYLLPEYKPPALVTLIS